MQASVGSKASYTYTFALLELCIGFGINDSHLHNVLPRRLCTLDNIFCKHLMLSISVSCCVFFSESAAVFYIKISCCVLHQNQLLCSTSKSAAVFYFKISCCVLFQSQLLCFISKSAAVFYIKVSCCVLYRNQLLCSISKSAAVFHFKVLSVLAIDRYTCLGPLVEQGS